MAFIRFHTTGLNTDWIVRWEDHADQDILVITLGAADPLGGSLVLRMYGEDRVALLGHLTHTSEDLLKGDPWLGPRHTWRGVPVHVRRAEGTPDGSCKE